MKNQNSRVAFNLSSSDSKPIKPRFYADWEVKQKLDQFKLLAKNDKQRKDMEDLKKVHLNQSITKNDKRAVQRRNFKDFYNQGFHTQEQKNNLDAQYKEEDRKQHLNTLNKGKSLYRHFSLSHSFLNAKKEKNRGMEKSISKA